MISVNKELKYKVNEGIFGDLRIPLKVNKHQSFMIKKQK